MRHIIVSLCILAAILGISLTGNKKLSAKSNVPAAARSALLKPSEADVIEAKNSETRHYSGRIKYRGVILKDGQAAPDSEYQISFTLYHSSDDGDGVWTGRYIVHTSNGVFHISLGSGKYPLPEASDLEGDLFLGVKIGDYDELPRAPLSVSIHTTKHFSGAPTATTIDYKRSNNNGSFSGILADAVEAQIPIELSAIRKHSGSWGYPDDGNIIVHNPVNDQSAASVADDRAGLPGANASQIDQGIGSMQLPIGLRIEASVAPPMSIPDNLYELGKFGEVSLEYIPTLNDIGATAQALHVEHHLLMYAIGFSTDINTDRMFIATVGVSHYQTGNDWQPYINAPFARIIFQSSQKNHFFVYSEIEATMNATSFLSGFIGGGIKLSKPVKIVAGFHHTEIVIPTEQTVLQINGLKGLISYGF